MRGGGVSRLRAMRGRNDGWDACRATSCLLMESLSNHLSGPLPASAHPLTPFDGAQGERGLVGAHKGRPYADCVGTRATLSF